jgi:hypothetical protein
LPKDIVDTKKTISHLTDMWEKAMSGGEDGRVDSSTFAKEVRRTLGKDVEAADDETIMAVRSLLTKASLPDEAVKIVRKAVEAAKELDTILPNAPAAKREIDAIMQSMEYDLGITVVTAPTKSRLRALEKTMKENKGNVSKLKDLARGTIIAGTDGTAQAAIGGLRTKAEEFYGYSGVIVNVKAKNGVTAEIQINSPEMMYAKDRTSASFLTQAQRDEIRTRTGVEAGLGHDFYEIIRGRENSDPVRVKAEADAKAYYANFKGLDTDYLESDRTLLAVHNTDARKLAFALKTGGLANPSLAVTDISKDTFKDFGDITLIARKEMLAGGRTFNADIYSPRYPETEYIASKQVAESVTADLAPYYKRLGLGSPFFSGSRGLVKELMTSQHPIQLKFLEDTGKVEKGSITDSEAVRDAFHASEGAFGAFDDYVEEYLSEKGAVLSFLKGANRSGNKTYVPATAESASKIMGKMKLKGGEGSFSGVGGVRAALAKELKGTDAIRKAKGSIIPKSKMEKVKEAAQREFFSLSSGFNIPPEVLADYMSGSDGGWLRKNIGTFIKDPEYAALALKRIEETVKDFRNLPTGYFETKFKRPVKLDEFGAALVPSSAPEWVAKRLEELGLEVRIFDDSDSRNRERAMREWKDYNFAIGGLMAAGAAAGAVAGTAEGDDGVDKDTI